MVSPEEVLRFWLDEVGPKGWYQTSDALDEEVRERFASAWENARAGAYGLWLTYPTARSPMSSSPISSRATCSAARPAPLPPTGRADGGQGGDQSRLGHAHRRAGAAILLPAADAFGKPLRSGTLRAPHLRADAGARPGNLLHARAHREVIRRFGRFPYRNAALGRASTTPERLSSEGGYGALVREVTEAA